VKTTETGLISPTSISKVLMPFAFKDIAVRSQVADNSADVMQDIAKSGVDCSRRHRSRRPLQQDGPRA
jgi:hypothetical protein